MMRSLLSARTIARAKKFSQPRRLPFHICCTQPVEKLHLLFNNLQTTFGSTIEFCLWLQVGVERSQTKRTSKSQQVFHMCSVNQGMSGFGGRSCRDNEKVSVINFGRRNSKKEIFKSVCSLSKFMLCDVFTGIVVFLFSYIMRLTSVLHVSNKACILC